MEVRQRGKQRREKKASKRQMAGRKQGEGMDQEEAQVSLHLGQGGTHGAPRQEDHLQEEGVVGLWWPHRAHAVPVPFSPSRAEATHLHLVPVFRRAAAPHLLHQPREQVVGAERPAGELSAALGAGGDTGAALPIALDAGLAEVVHAVQHDWLPEELAADGTCQLLPQAPVLAPASHPCWHMGPS